MPIEVKMAKLSPTMESGQMVKWLVKVGDKVKEGDTLAEIQTDKAVMPMESFDEGIVALLDVKEGRRHRRSASASSSSPRRGKTRSRSPQQLGRRRGRGRRPAKADDAGASRRRRRPAARRRPANGQDAHGPARRPRHVEPAAG